MLDEAMIQHLFDASISDELYVAGLRPMIDALRTQELSDDDAICIRDAMNAQTAQRVCNTFSAVLRAAEAACEESIALENLKRVHMCCGVIVLRAVQGLEASKKA